MKFIYIGNKCYPIFSPYAFEPNTHLVSQHDDGRAVIKWYNPEDHCLMEWVSREPIPLGMSRIPSTIEGDVYQYFDPGWLIG